MSKEPRKGQCPICNQTFPVELLNSHANKCLGDGENSSEASDCSDVAVIAVKQNGGLSKKRKSEDKQAWENIFRSQQTKRSKVESTVTQESVSHSEKLTRQTVSKQAEDMTNNRRPSEFASVSKMGMAERGQINKKSTTKQKFAPLAERMRPILIDDYVGQEKAVGKQSLLRSILRTSSIPSLIFWGPPGCGKTTLAKIMANHCKEHSNTKFVQLSAAAAGVADVKEVIKAAKTDQVMFKRKTVLFLDEIHRFNKLQQDALLPHVEDGTVVLLGATTENPSFHVNSALLSRSRVIVLEKLSTQSMVKIVSRATEKLGLEIVENGAENSSSFVAIEKDAITALANLCDGDARTALNSLDMAVQSCRGGAGRHCDSVNGGSGVGVITVELVKESLQRSHILYDKTGEEHYNCMSALQKSIRGSDANAALYWTARMLEGGENPLIVARRLVRTASEDIGLADPQALPFAVAAYQASHLIGMPECDVILAQCAVQLARAPKSPEVYLAYSKAKNCVRNHEGPMPGVPLHLRNAPTKLMKDLGYGKGYSYKPDADGKYNVEFLPEGLEGTDFFS